MSLDVTGLFDKVQSHALSLGIFDRVNTHEPKSAPGNRVSAAIIVDWVGPARGVSGLNSTTALVRFKIRIYMSMLQEPQDGIDPEILKAVDVLMAAYSGDFDLGSSVKEVDLLGEQGIPLSAQSGYLTQDQKPYRLMEVILPIIINDVWTQSP